MGNKEHGERIMRKRGIAVKREHKQCKYRRLPKELFSGVLQYGIQWVLSNVLANLLS